MLRVRFMPSDFHPLLLVLGDRGDLLWVAALLERFAADGHELRLDAQAAQTPTQVRVISGGGLPLGLWPEDAAGQAFVWRLDPGIAQRFGVQLRDLVAHDALSGSETLECGVIGELPVKVSHGEFTDDFLMPGSAIPS